MRRPRFLFLSLCIFLILAVGRAAEPQPQGEGRKAKGEGAVENTPSPSAVHPSPFFRPGDVIALVGGEDMVVASEYGYLELLLTRALPDYRLRFRNLAWEGDTVFEQRRDLNFPTWEEQLDKIGATVVICQFGQMESIMGVNAPGFPGGLTAEDAKNAEGRRGKAEAKENSSADLSSSSAPSAVKSAPNGLPEFIAAYEKLIERFSAGGKRRVVLLPMSRMGTKLEKPWPHPTPPPLESPLETVLYREATAALATKLKLPFLQREAHLIEMDGEFWRDHCHLSKEGQRVLADQVTYASAVRGWITLTDSPRPGDSPALEKIEQLRQLIIAKNRLWFDYWRPQNWAFLAGDRTAQPSSRDHLDPSKRWFPPEREAFLPLVEAKEKEIDALAQQLAGK